KVIQPDILVQILPGKLGSAFQNAGLAHLFAKGCILPVPDGVPCYVCNCDGASQVIRMVEILRGIV
ncbi:MAG TPA: hypothetical protein PLC07_07670, partial [Bacillota bacterium]|nr:hypothetical protein [Bacillota bacterium]